MITCTVRQVPHYHDAMIMVLNTYLRERGLPIPSPRVPRLSSLRPVTNSADLYQEPCVASGDTKPFKLQSENSSWRTRIIPVEAVNSNIEPDADYSSISALHVLPTSSRI